MIPRLVSRTTDSGAGMTVTENREKVHKRLAIPAYYTWNSTCRLSPRVTLHENVKVYILDTLDIPMKRAIKKIM